MAGSSPGNGERPGGEENLPPVPPRPRKASEVVTSLPYYHPNLKNMDDVKEIMVPYVLQDGYYLVRSSFTKQGTYTISVMHEKSIKHLNVSQTNNHYFLHDRQFPTLDQLIRHYRHHDVPNVEGVLHVRLRYPIKYKRDEIDLPREMHPSYKSKRPPAIPMSSSLGDGMVNRGADSPTSPPFATTHSSHSLQTTMSESILLPLDRSKISKTRSDGQLPSGSSLSKRASGIFSFFRRDKKPSTEDSESIGSKSQTSDTGSLGRMRDRAQSDSSSNGSDRPPLPIPRPHSIRSKSATNEGFVYDAVRDPYEDRSQQLIEQLRINDPTPRCDCGLYFDESELPRGWSIHVSKDELTNGRIFFMDPHGNTTWHLPLEVSLELSPEQQDKVRAILARSMLDQQRRAQTVSAGASSAASASAGAADPVFGNQASMPRTGPRDIAAHQGAAQASNSRHMGALDDADDDVFD